jgi:hypothetical protein
MRKGGAARAMITLAEIDALSGRRRGAFDVPCPLCGPLRRSARNRRKRVMRIWRTEPGFATYHCARCGEQGFARDRDNRNRAPDPARLAQARAETVERDRALKAKRQQLALWLGQRRRPIAGSIAEPICATRADTAGRCSGRWASCRPAATTTRP